MPSSLCLVFAGLLWGAGGLTGTLLAHAARVSPLLVAALRLLTGGALLLAVRAVRGRRWPSSRAAWRRVAVTGLLAAAFQACYFSAIGLTSVSLATLVTIGGTPVLIQVADLARRRGRWERPAAARTALALAGLALLVGLPPGGLGPSDLAGAGMALLAATGFAALTVTAADPVPGLEADAVTGLGFTLGGLVLLPLAAAVSSLPFRPSLAAVGWLAALATGPTAVAYTLYFRGLRGSTAGTGAIMSLLEPLTATVLSVVLLGNRLSPAGIAGAALLAAAVAHGALTAPATPALAGANPVR